MKARVITYITALLSVTCAMAQNSDSILKNCLLRGLENNYSLRMVRNEAQIAENNTGWANAGMLPVASATASYSGTLDNNDATLREEGNIVSQRNITDHTLHAGIDLQWTIFDGFKMQADYNRLKELHLVLSPENPLIHHYRQVLRRLMPWFLSEEVSES